VTALSVPILGEKVAISQWLAIGIGLLGVLVILRPTGQGMVSWAGLMLCKS
jgi:drug/metabolite transporter (DMT)-like permease